VKVIDEAPVRAMGPILPGITRSVGSNPSSRRCAGRQKAHHPSIFASSTSKDHRNSHILRKDVPWNRTVEEPVNKTVIDRV